MRAQHDERHGPEHGPVEAEPHLVTSHASQRAPGREACREETARKAGHDDPGYGAPQLRP
jgi:hypothetical protein